MHLMYHEELVCVRESRMLLTYRFQDNDIIQMDLSGGYKAGRCLRN